jgi:hypothetical protein
MAGPYTLKLVFQGFVVLVGVLILSGADYISIRNEYFNDLKGQRTGTKTRYTEHLLGWGHWIGTTILFRPELRFERAYDRPAYDNGKKKNQLTFAGDVVFFF